MAPRVIGIRVAAICCALFALAPTTAHAQTRPTLADEYRDVELPARRSNAGAAAATTQPAVAAVGRGESDPFDSKRLGIALLVVVAAILIASKVWRRVGIPGLGGGRAGGALQIVSRLGVAPRQQVMLLRVGRRLVLVGNSGGQMSPLCEIADPEEVAEITGKVATERDESAASFASVLGGEEKAFDESTNVDVVAGDDREIATTRDEISGLMDKVRNLSKQFGGGGGGAGKEGRA